MPTAAEHLGLAYPFLVDPADDRFVPAEVMAWAMSVAQAFRPLCLPTELQDLAQAHYAAYLVAARRTASEVFGSQSASQATAGPIVERQEGQVRVRYGGGSSSTSSSTSSRTGGGDPGPAAPYAAWAQLAAMCGPVPGIDPANPEANKPRGGIIVRSNPIVLA